MLHPSCSVKERPLHCPGMLSARRSTGWPAAAAAVGLATLAALAACGPGSGTGTGERPALQILSPARGAVLTHPRVEVGILVPEAGRPGRLEVHLGERDLSPRFASPVRRMRSLGGDAITMATVDLIDQAPGDLRLEAIWIDADGERSVGTRFFRKASKFRKAFVVTLAASSCSSPLPAAGETRFCVDESIPSA